MWEGFEKITREKNEVKWICSSNVKASQGGVARDGGRWALKEVT